jgi:hypothetical protein
MLHDGPHLVYSIFFYVCVEINIILIYFSLNNAAAAYEYIHL